MWGLGVRLKWVILLSKLFWPLCIGVFRSTKLFQECTLSWMKGSGSSVQIESGVRSLTTMAKFCPLLTTYLPTPAWHWWRNSFTVKRKHLSTSYISRTTYLTRLCQRSLRTTPCVFFMSTPRGEKRPIKTRCFTTTTSYSWLLTSSKNYLFYNLTPWYFFLCPKAIMRAD